MGKMLNRFRQRPLTLAFCILLFIFAILHLSLLGVYLEEGEKLTDNYTGSWFIYLFFVYIIIDFSIREKRKKALLSLIINRRILKVTMPQLIEELKGQKVSIHTIDGQFYMGELAEISDGWIKIEKQKKKTKEEHLVRIDYISSISKY